MLFSLCCAQLIIMEKHINSANVEKRSEIKERNISLEHHKDTTVGLCATDRPDLIPEELKSLFFQITYNETEVVD